LPSIKANKNKNSQVYSRKTDSFSLNLLDGKVCPYAVQMAHTKHPLVVSCRHFFKKAGISMVVSDAIISNKLEDRRIL
jgi:hypothetical protein